MWYYITTIVFCVIYVLGIFFIRKINKYKILDIGWLILIFIFQLIKILYFWINEGITSWNFYNALPTANISPFMFIFSIILLVLPKTIRTYGNTLISLLSLAMFLACMVMMIFNGMRDYNYYFNFVLEAFNHILFSLYGFYLYKTQQTYHDKKRSRISGMLIIGVAFIMLILNLIFKTSFFGLSMYGNHNIYTIVICESSIISAIIYFEGLTILLGLGSLYLKVINYHNN